MFIVIINSNYRTFEKTSDNIFEIFNYLLKMGVKIDYTFSKRKDIKKIEKKKLLHNLKRN